MDTTLDPQAKALAQAIKRAETGEGDTYNMEGKSGEFGAYQFMPDTYKAYAKKYLGDENAEPNKENQNKIAYSFVKEKKMLASHQHKLLRCGTQEKVAQTHTKRDIGE